MEGFRIWKDLTLLKTNISPCKALLKMILFSFSQDGICQFLARTFHKPIILGVIHLSNFQGVLEFLCMGRLG